MNQTIDNIMALTPGAGDGYVLVPVKPTEEMIYAAQVAGHPGDGFHVVADYEAMLAAAPQPKREWVGLTDEDVRELDTSEFWDDHTPADFVRLVENKLREKNGGGV